MWPTVTTYSLASGINIVIASIAYVWTQKAYVLQKQGRTTFADEFEYWTVKSLFACALVSLFNAVAAGVMAANLTWLAGTFFLGNLYTLSVLLTLGARFPHAPVVMTFPSAPVLETASYRTSTATLTDAALWEDIVKSQAMKASIVSIPKEAKLPDYASGYRVNDGAV
ncbi:hypothetical protein C8Q76DRAFT_733041 [Earliella scabrosa]|nr:hypothetical protein C8Q76DRAFT_733041 [Earliella scabrosa]